jgi:hypothetical protein
MDKIQLERKAHSLKEVMALLLSTEGGQGDAD